MTTAKEFGEMVQIEMDKLTEGLSVEKLVSVDYIQLNKDAIKNAQAKLLEKVINS